MNKYRAWDKINKTMLYEIDVYHSGHIGFDEKVARKMYGRKFNRAINSFLSGDDYYWRSDGFDLMQSTGLKDATKWDQLSSEEQGKWLGSGKTKEEWNGREIFEGDIIRHCITNPLLFIAKIELTKRGFQTKFVYADDGKDAQGYFMDQWEIIGNRYQNPELIGGRDE